MSDYDELYTRVHAAVKPFFSGPDLFKVLGIWKKDFAARSRFPQREFTLTVCNQMKPAATYDQVLESVISAMQADLDSLPPVPSDSMLLANEDGLAPARSFGFVLSNLGKQLEYQECSDITKLTFSALIAANFSATLAEAVVTNIDPTKGLTLIRIKDEGKYRIALNLVYVAMCESLGPVESDQLLSDVVKHVNRTPFGKAYSASNFL